ncbi:MAG: PAS domain S-box protein [Desulfovibrio sp.]|nr:MAG: PAS domain S-box protein [Desulfovibrio sp.]
MNKAGDVRWLEQFNTLLRDSQGKLVALQGIVLDITQRKEAEVALATSEERYRELVENAASVILRMDPKGVVTFFNEYAEQLFGFSREEIIGKNVVGTIVPKTESSGRDLEEMIRDIGAKPEAFASNENENMRKDGKRLWLTWTNKAVRDSQGRVEELLCIGKDITERKLIQEMLLDSEQRYRAVFEGAGDILFLHDMQGRIIDMNQEALDLLGYTKQELLGLTPEDLDSRGKSMDLGHNIEILLTEGKLFGETDVLCKDGSLLPVEVLCSIVSLAGEPTILNIMRDITRRKQDEAAIQELEQRYKLVFEHACDGMYIHDMAGHFLDVNPMGHKRLGYSREEFLALNVRDVDLPGHEERFLERRQLVHELGSLFFEAEHVHKDGSILPVDVRATLVSIGGRDVVMAIARDVAERRKYEHLLVQAKEDAESASENKSRFVAELSHSIRTHLASILDMLQVLDATEVEGDLKRYVDTAMTSGRTLQSMFKDIMDLSKIEIGAVEIRLTAFVPDLVLNHVLESLRSQAAAKQVALVVDLGGTPLPAVVSDELRFRRIVEALVANAVRRTRQGEIHVTLSFLAGEEDEGRLLAGVSDTRHQGAGQEQAAEAGSGGERRDADNTLKDLGLSIAQGLVHVLGGDISLHSEPGRGMESVFHIPVQIAGNRESFLSQEQGAAFTQVGHVARGEPGDQAANGGSRVLVVDDNEINRFTMLSLLNLMGQKPLAVSSGKEALELLASTDHEPFDLVLMDIRMPGMDGMEVTRRIRESGEEWAQVPIWAVTAHAMKGDKERLLAAGLDGYLAKPVDKKELAAVLEQVKIQNN